MSIITSLLDTDQYKLSMGQFAFHFQPGRKKVAEYSMKCRSGQNLIPLKDKLEEEIEAWLNLKFKADELDYLASIKVGESPVFKQDYLDFLSTMDLKKNLEIKVVEEKGHLNIRVKGEWVYSIFCEVPFLAMVQELYWREELSPEAYAQAEAEGVRRVEEKVKYLNTTKIKFSEFGTRRRFSLKMQREALARFKVEASSHLLGTSNVMLAKEFGLNPVGTHAHEFFMAMQRLASSFKTSQKEALEAWLNEYPDKLKIALTDIFGTDMFLRDFTYDLALAFEGVRQDSGTPREFALKMKAHYESLGINPKDKTILFSDDLNFQKANDLDEEFSPYFKVVFGIGTYCSNDTGHKPVSIVMKMVRMNEEAVIKISDSPGKVMCEDQAVTATTQAWIEEVTGAEVVL